MDNGHLIMLVDKGTINVFKKRKSFFFFREKGMLQDTPDGNQVVINTALMWWPFVYPICQKASNPRCLKPPYFS